MQRTGGAATRESGYSLWWPPCCLRDRQRADPGWPPTSSPSQIGSSCLRCGRSTWTAVLRRQGSQ